MNKAHGRENDSVAVVPEVDKSEVAIREEAIQAFWLEHDIFNKSIEKPAGEDPAGQFTFYDGPPFATGTPHYGHILASTIKDTVPRFWTMNGLRVNRTWGWDCHGLPLENLIEKKLGLATKRDIEEYGVKNFNEAARSTVMEYADYWKMAIPRMGRWADMENDYKTMDSTYTESVWWVFSELHKKGLVFEGFKTMHLCPRCGTTLSNFEVNQGYKDIKDIAVTVKLPLLDDAGNVTDTSLLVWTTTPWTLPGNMAAAVHHELDYVKVKVSADGVSEYYILAKGRLSQLGEAAYETVEEMKGAALVGKSYQSPFNYLHTQDFDKTNAWKIWHADYVEVGTEGTGAVHIAPAYGDDDMKLAQANNVPIIHHVDTAGHFVSFVTDFAGRLVKPKDDDTAGVDHKDTDIEILKALQAAGKVFKKENITHSYPHCWRCDTPLLNYATTSWFVNVPKIKDELIAANNAVNWIPDHVGSNRFGNWLEGARDWAVSRQRYWGAPLPIWKNPKTGDFKVFGSLAELQQYVPKSGNTYFVMRHAEAASNLTGIIDAIADENNPLTEAGITQCKEAAETLRTKGITHIVHSGMQRTRETALAIARELGLPETAVSADARIIELQTGAAYEGKTWDEYNANYSSEEEKFTKVIPGVENRYDLIKRAGEFLYDFDAAHQNETVLIVGHASSTFALRCVAEGAEHKRVIELKKQGYYKNAEVHALPFTPVPHNDLYALDYHRPYIDDIKLVDTDGTQLVRVPDVFDCWFESGSMPYAQHHFMGQNPEQFLATQFPAQFIAEGLDQTRGWFYSLIVLGTALFGKAPFENVIVNGLALAEDGKKMSKSLKNYPDPMELVDRVGADAVRYYMLTAPIVRGEDLNFSEKEVTELQRKNIGRLHNVLAMYEMYANGTDASGASDTILDRWILARLNQLIADTTAGYKSYELDKATRPLADFIDDVSVWYLRRSRERLKSDDSEDKTKVLGTLRFILRELAKVMAPAMPFYAEYLYRAVRAESEPESVHLTAWPTGDTVDTGLIESMGVVRMFVTAGLEARTKANIKVRQPLSELFIRTTMLPDTELLDLIKDELNVKQISLDGVESGADTTSKITLITELTPELIAEGAVREVMRAVQDMRKDAGLEPSDRIVLTIDTNENGQNAVNTHKESLLKTVGATDIVFDVTFGTSVTSGDYSFVCAISQ
ncbi:class I tRNA ligase family protein [Patescibacteria group bacterium]|nr:class I tRNA ligase family protein [Patescibacteria group bacterium]